MLKDLNLQNAFEKRTIQPLYAHHSAVPVACFVDLDSVTTTPIYPGMVASKTTGSQVRISNATTVPFGLFGDYFNTNTFNGGQTEMGVWVGGQDAWFAVLAGPDATHTPLDPNVTWSSLNGTAGGVLLYSDANGRLTTTDGTGPVVARLVEAPSDRKIIIQLVLDTV